MSDSVIDAAHPRFKNPKPSQKTKPADAMKIALVQMSVGKDKAKNVSEAVKYIYEASKNGAELIVLPECFNSPYGTKYFSEYAETLDGPTCGAVRAAAAGARAAVVAGSLPERRGAAIYNTSAVWSADGERLAVHRKMHLFDVHIPGGVSFRESATLSAGGAVTLAAVGAARVGLGICYDLRFPELSTLMTLKGCNILIYPAAFNMTTGPKHWELLARARANDHQLYVALASPARDPAADYVAYGHSLVVDPWGEVVAQLDHRPGVLYADIDFNKVNEVRKQIPISTQRRCDVYDTIHKENTEC